MKTKTIEVCDAIHIDVSCELNDPVDVKCGGLPVLGYDFYISPDENIEEWKKFVMDCIKKYRRPFMGISTDIRKDLPVDCLWTKEMIDNCIKTHEI